MNSVKMSAHGGNVSAEILIKDVAGNVALRHSRLTFTLLITGQSEATQNSHLLAMELDINVSCTRGQRAVYLTSLQVPWAVGCDLSNGVRSSEFQTDLVLESKQIEALDELRSGEDLVLLLRAHLKYERRRDGFIGDAYSQQESLSLNPMEWNKLLRSMGHSGYIYVDIPIPSDASPDLRRCAELLEEANRALRTQPPREVVFKCRQALESLQTGLKDTQWLGTLADKKKDSTKTERIGVIRRSLQSLNHLAAHEDSIGSATDWSREDAILALGVTASVVRWFICPAKA